MSLYQHGDWVWGLAAALLVVALAIYFFGQ
jgi:hypothetical protein